MQSACLDDLPTLAYSMVLDALDKQDTANFCLISKGHNSRVKNLLTRLHIDESNASERLRWFPGQVLKTIVYRGNELPKMLPCLANSPHVPTISTIIIEDRVWAPNEDFNTRVFAAFAGVAWYEPAELNPGLKRLPALKRLVLRNPKFANIGVLLDLGLLTDILNLEFEGISFNMHMQPQKSSEIQERLSHLHGIVRQQSKLITAKGLFVFNIQMRSHIPGNFVLRHLSSLAACMDVESVNELHLNWIDMKKPCNAMARLTALFPNIRVLHIRACRLSNNFLLEAVQGFPNLTEATLYNCKGLTEAAPLTEALMTVKLLRLSFNREPLPFRVEMSCSGVSNVVVRDLETWVNFASPDDLIDLKLTH